MPVTFYATNNFTGNGTTTTWNINFADGYLSTADVKARYVDSSGAFVDIPITSVVGNVVTISPAQPNGRVFSIYRDTQKSQPLVDFADGAILNETNLDTLATQAVMVAAESSDLANGLVGTAYTALTTANTAITTANNASSAANTAVATANSANSTANAASTVAANASTAANNAVTTANAASSAATSAVSTANSASSLATTANNTANTALSTANSASSTAGTALSTANTAATNASAAVTTANSASSTANTASTNASNAVSTANNALSVANGIDAKATTALTNSTNAVNTANAASSTANAIDGKAQTALDNSTAAVSTANAASTTANNAAAAVAGKADLASPAFTGNPTAPTQTAGDNDTSIATTAFVQTAIAGKADLASPTFTGDPKAPTPATSDNDTSIATTAFVKAAIAASPGGLSVVKATRYLASGTHTLQATTKFIEIFMVGGGGGAGGQTSSTGAPAAGAIRLYPHGNPGCEGRAFIDLAAIGVTGGSNLAVTVGTVGTGSNGTGSGGGFTRLGLGSYTITAPGGTGGQGAQFVDLTTFPNSVAFLATVSPINTTLPAGSYTILADKAENFAGRVQIMWRAATDSSSMFADMSGSESSCGRSAPIVQIATSGTPQGFGCGGKPMAINSGFTSATGGNGTGGLMYIVEYG